ncbi:uncharacterized protein LY89DRAFT_250173 [Mollisia scopiformis]|uniref:Uncharacterized protein n=1 Tax=Mollisia scopiformis TaxID=149040 RepID=A0A194WS05_MOLSC|nr:uncharacterized protein LY89DRAFT_250173 [Mollisia scopiformis]KUJ10756.1 hypothetical protein LY89DRAFT_250173 [Mollisia scopiformis]
MRQVKDFIEQKLEKIKHKMTKERPRGSQKQKRASTSSIGSSQGFPESPALSSQNPRTRQNSNQTTQSNTDALSRMNTKSTTCGGDYVVVSSNLGRYQVSEMDHQPPTRKDIQPEEAVSSQQRTQPISPGSGGNKPTQDDLTPGVEGILPQTLLPEPSSFAAETDPEEVLVPRPNEEPQEVHQPELLSVRSQSPTEEDKSSNTISSPHADLHLDSISLNDNPELLHRILQKLVRKKDDWDKLRSLRKNELGVRSSLQAQRTVLQEKEAAKQVADNDFMKLARENPPLESQRDLLESHARLQQTRNDYGPALVECVQREEALDVVEWEMGRLEDQLYVILFGEIQEDTNLASNFFPTETIVGSASTPSPWLGLVAGVQDRFQPLHTQYLSRQGDMDLAKERLGNLEQEAEDLYARQEYLQRLGHDLSPELSEALREIPSREAQIRSEMADIEADVDRLRQECLDEGIDLDGESDDGSGDSLSFFEDDVQQDNH